MRMVGARRDPGTDLDRAVWVRMGDEFAGLRRLVGDSGGCPGCRGRGGWGEVEGFEVVESDRPGASWC